MAPLISVVIPLYNKEKLVARTLQTVLAQTFTDFEVVIVDDGSTDSSAAIVESFSDSRIRLIRQKNGGVSAARNKGIEEASGKYIAFLDADDEWDSEYLATMHSLIDAYPECDVFGIKFAIIDNNRNITEHSVNNIQFDSTTGQIDNYFEVASASLPPLCSSSVMISKSALEDIGGFPVGIKDGEDLITWARLAVKYKIAFSNRTQAYFVHDEVLFNADQKNRAPSEDDYVGDQLESLHRNNLAIPGLKQYVALWHKMRCRTHIFFNDRTGALRECMKSLGYSFTPKACVFLALCFLPLSLSANIIKRISKS